MPHRRRLAVTFLICIALNGCATQKVHVTVKDYDTGAPIEGATVQIAYQHDAPFFIAPQNARALTDSRGTANLSGARGGSLVISKEHYDWEYRSLASTADEVTGDVVMHLSYNWRR